MSRGQRIGRASRAIRVALVVLACACQRPKPADVERSTVAPANQPSVPAAASALPALRIGTSDDYAPFSAAGAGFDVEVAKRMAADLGYRIEWVRFAWPELQARVAAGAFDLAMGGITWRAERSVLGEMSRAVAVSGPCVLSRKPPGTVAVNRGGILERWARERFAAAQIRTVDDNRALPRLLEQGEVDAIVTDSAELAHFAKAGWQSQCEPPRDRKVYWLAPGRAAELLPRVDGWLAAHEPQLQALRAQWLKQPTRWTPLQHLVDLLARRLALMPAVAAYKRAHGLPIEDLPREALVLKESVASAAEAGLQTESVRALFAEQIALAKAVQQRAGATEPLDLERVLRPALSSLGERILAALAACAHELPRLQSEQLDLLVPLLQPAERQRLLQALRAVRPAAP